MIITTRRDVGYSVYSRLESAIREWIGSRLEKTYGDGWVSYIPKGIYDKCFDRLSPTSGTDPNDPFLFLEQSDIPDLMEILCHKKAHKGFVSFDDVSADDFRHMFKRLYELRCKIAHVKSNFTAIDLDLLIEIAKRFMEVDDFNQEELFELFSSLESDSQLLVTKVPSSFYEQDNTCEYSHVTNLPPGDYDPDGGFIGRSYDIKSITKYLLSDQDRVITITGAGGVGKTAIAHKICNKLLEKQELPFDAIVWVSAKNEKLTLTGIEQIEPTLRNYDSLLDNILETFGWYDEIDGTIEGKEDCVNVILEAGEKGLLLVVDNLETIVDDRVIEFIKNIPRHSKALVTSRLGLGEIERRYQLKALDEKDSVMMFRTIAKEKGIDSLVKQSDELLLSYTDNMARYPLAIKWVVGQVALGRNIDTVIDKLMSSTGDVAKFCFDHIFNKLLNDEAKMVLYALAASERPLTQGVLVHLTGQDPETLDTALKDLTIASLVMPSQTKTISDTIETRYELLQLTSNYLQLKLKTQHKVHSIIRSRIETVQNLIEEIDKAGKQYRYSLADMGARTDEEKIAATWAITAYQKYQTGDYEGAVEAYERAVAIAPAFPAIYRNWATMEVEAGFYEKAERLMEKATRLNPNDFMLWFVWGNIEKRRQRYEKAYNFYNTALCISPNDPPILGALGEVEKRRGNYEEADQLMRKALSASSITGSNRRNAIISNTSIADNLRRWAEALSIKRQFTEALNKLEEAYQFAKTAIGLDAEDLRSKDIYITVCKDLAIELLKQKGIEIALPYFRLAITQKPRRTAEKKANTVCCHLLARVLLENGQIDDAKTYYNIGKRSIMPDRKWHDKYKELEGELSQERSIGKLYFIKKEEGYGFIEPEKAPGDRVFLHIKDIVPEISDWEFENLLDATFSYIELATEKGVAATKARLVKDK